MQHVETDSVWRVIEGKLCLGSGIRIRYPDHHQNLMEWSLGSWLPSHNISFKSVHNFLSNPANRQTNERALRECILCKIGLTYWVIYLVDWQWQRSRTQSIGPNDSNEKCAMSRVLFGINIAAIQKIRDLDLLHLTLTFFLYIWPWHLTLRLIYYYLDALKKTLQKFILLTSRDAKTAPHSLARRPTYRYWLVFCQLTFCNQPEVSTTSGSKVMAQKVMFMVFDVFDLDRDISRSFDFCEFAICSLAWLV